MIPYGRMTAHGPSTWFSRQNKEHHSFTRVYIYIYMYIYVYVCTWFHRREWLPMVPRRDAPVNLIRDITHSREYVCIDVCIYMCIYVHVYLKYIHTKYTNIYKQTEQTCPGIEAAIKSHVLCVAVWCSVLQRVAVRCSVSQSVAVCCSVLQCVAECCSLLQRVVVCGSVSQSVAVRCSVFQCVALCCTVLHCVALCCSVLHCVAGNRPVDWRLEFSPIFSVLQRVAVCCSVLHYVALCCTVLQCIALCCRQQTIGLKTWV